MRTLAVLLATTAPLIVAQASTRVDVPLIGCESGGQADLSKPSDGKVALAITPSASRQLSYYKAGNDLGVLAPRDWHCYGVNGSGGGALMITPQPIDTYEFFSNRRKNFSGPVIVITQNFGSTSGRMAVAEVIARVFPAYRQFTKDVGESFGTNYVYHPYPKDKLVYLSARALEYTTPPFETGLGTGWAIAPDTEPVQGFARLIGKPPDLVLLSVRLPQEMTNLAPVIVQQAERDASHLPVL